MKIERMATVEKTNFDKFKSDILDQIVKSDHEWFYFVESENPHMATMIRIEEISSLDIFQQQVLSKEQMKSAVDKLTHLLRQEKKEGE